MSTKNKKKINKIGDNSKQGVKTVGVMLMTYGSPTTLDDIPDYLRRVYEGREASQEVIAEFRRRYGLIGGSPLVRITQEQAAALQKELNKKHNGERTFLVRAAMRFSHPFIEEMARELVEQSDYLIGIIMSPQYSPIIMKGYVRELEHALAESKGKNVQLKMAQNWFHEKYFVKALAERVEQALTRFPEELRASVTVLFSAHSMPKRVIEKEPDYINNLKETAQAVASEIRLEQSRWMFCYQSAGHTPEEWLKPDFADIMPQLANAGKKHVLIAPVQFLSDHLEILYDVGIAAREQAVAHGMQFVRTESLNTSPLFIKALASVVEDLL